MVRGRIIRKKSQYIERTKKERETGRENVAKKVLVTRFDALQVLQRYARVSNTVLMLIYNLRIILFGIVLPGHDGYFQTDFLPCTGLQHCISLLNNICFRLCFSSS